MTDVLDNPIWHALTGPQAHVAVGHGHARHFPRDMAPFSAIESSDPLAYADLAKGLPANTEARLFRLSEEPLPPGWEKIDAFPMLQMVSRHALQIASSYPVPDVLTAADAAAMHELARAVQPGPFGPRTHLLGVFGYPEGGRLVAMARERMRLPGHTELSAICTHPDERGRGHAERLTRYLMNKIIDRGELPFFACARRTRQRRYTHVSASSSGGRSGCFGASRSRCRHDCIATLSRLVRRLGCLHRRGFRLGHWLLRAGRLSPDTACH